jgi:ribosomal protein L37E
MPVLPAAAVPAHPDAPNAPSSGPFVPSGQQVPPAVPASNNLAGVSPVVGAGRPNMITVTCFRCGAANQSDRLFCTSCGYELSDSKRIYDRVMGPNGRPILARLTIQNGPFAGRSYLFHQDVTTIGRTNGNDLIISGRTVSRRHARLWFDANRWYIADMQSINGTLVNSTRVQPNQPMPLNDGDVIHLGDEVLLFNIVY